MRGARARRAGLVAVGVALAAGCAALGAADRWAGGPAAALRIAAPPVEPLVSALPLACPGGLADPYEPDKRASGWAAWTSAGSRSPLRSGWSLAVDDPAGVGMTLTIQDGGDLRGITAAPCALPRARSWVAAGSTALSESLVVTLVNPAGKASVVTMRAFGPTGLRDEASPAVTVPAHSAVSVLPAAWFPDLDRLALRVDADGPGVAAWAQTSGLAGEVPLGADRVPFGAPARTLLVPGVRGGDGAVLRLANPGDEAARASVEVLGPNGAASLPGGRTRLDAGSVVDLNVSDVSTRTVALRVRADRPVLASVAMSTLGSPHALVRDRRWRARTVAQPAQTLRRIDLPGSEDLRRAAARAGAHTPGAGALRARLLLANGSDAPARVRLGGRSVRLGAGASTSLDLPGTARTLRSDRPVAVAVELSYATATGTVRTLAPLSQAGGVPASVPIDLWP